MTILYVDLVGKSFPLNISTAVSNHVRYSQMSMMHVDIQDSSNNTITSEMKKKTNMKKNPFKIVTFVSLYLFRDSEPENTKSS